jgi:hypothetical protein
MGAIAVSYFLKGKIERKSNKIVKKLHKGHFQQSILQGQ